MTLINAECRLAARPVGLPKSADWDLVEEAALELGCAVVRPGLVYGNGGNSDLASLIDRARAVGRAGHWGSGGTTQSYVHVADVAELFCLAAEHAPHRTILHGGTADVTQRELATAINRMIGAGEQTECLSLEQMLGITADTAGDVGADFNPAGLDIGIVGRNITPAQHIEDKRHQDGQTGVGGLHP